MSSEPAKGTLRPVRLLDSLVRDADHGRLPAMLIGLTLVTGLVDAVSILALGRVFVANMTGNVVFVGFALAGAPGFSLVASLLGLAGFLIGARLGGELVARRAKERRALFLIGLELEVGLLALAAVILELTGSPVSPGPRDGAVVCCAVAMGVRNAVVRRLAVPDLTTTVLTMTLTGVAADRQASARGATRLRRGLAVGTMLGGAVLGAVVVRHLGAAAGLWFATGVSALVLAVAATSRPAAATGEPAPAPR